MAMIQPSITAAAARSIFFHDTIRPSISTHTIYFVDGNGRPPDQMIQAAHHAGDVGPTLNPASPHATDYVDRPSPLPPAPNPPRLSRRRLHPPSLPPPMAVAPPSVPAALLSPTSLH
ncbi:hypothetical protein ACLOJK_034548 [Asimina triloba]